MRINLSVSLSIFVNLSLFLVNVSDPSFTSTFQPNFRAFRIINILNIDLTTFSVSIIKLFSNLYNAFRFPNIFFTHIYFLSLIEFNICNAIILLDNDTFYQIKYIIYAIYHNYQTQKSNQKN